MSRQTRNPKQTAWYFPLLLAPFLRLELGLTVRRVPKMPSLPPAPPVVETTGFPASEPPTGPGIAKARPTLQLVKRAS